MDPPYQEFAPPGIRFDTKACVLTAGTFLNGKIHIGLENQTGGRMGDPAVITLADRLRELCPRTGRLNRNTAENRRQQCRLFWITSSGVTSRAR